MDKDHRTLKSSQCRSPRPAGPASDEPPAVSVLASTDTVATGLLVNPESGSVNALSLPATFLSGSASTQMGLGDIGADATEVGTAGEVVTSVGLVPTSMDPAQEAVAESLGEHRTERLLAQAPPSTATTHHTLDASHTHTNRKFTLVPLSEESNQRSDLPNRIPLAELSVLRDIDSRISPHWAIQNVENSVTFSADTISDADREFSNILDAPAVDDLPLGESASPLQRHDSFAPPQVGLTPSSFTFRPVESVRGSREHIGVPPPTTQNIRSSSRISGRSSRSSKRSTGSAVDLQWLGDYMTRFASETAQERRELLRDSEVRFERTLQFASQREKLLHDATEKEKQRFYEATEKEKQNAFELFKQRELTMMEREAEAQRDREQAALQREQEILALARNREKQLLDIQTCKEKAQIQRERNIRGDFEKLNEARVAQAVTELKNEMLKAQVQEQKNKNKILANLLKHQKPHTVTRRDLSSSPEIDEFGQMITRHETDLSDAESHQDVAIATEQEVYDSLIDGAEVITHGTATDSAAAVSTTIQRAKNSDISLAAATSFDAIANIRPATPVARLRGNVISGWSDSRNRPHASAPAARSMNSPHQWADVTVSGLRSNNVCSKRQLSECELSRHMIDSSASATTQLIEIRSDDHTHLPSGTVCERERGKRQYLPSSVQPLFLPRVLDPIAEASVQQPTAPAAVEGRTQTTKPPPQPFFLDIANSADHVVEIDRTETAGLVDKPMSHINTAVALQRPDIEEHDYGATYLPHASTTGSGDRYFSTNICTTAVHVPVLSTNTVVTTTLRNMPAQSENLSTSLMSDFTSISSMPTHTQSFTPVITQSGHEFVKPHIVEPTAGRTSFTSTYEPSGQIMNALTRYTYNTPAGPVVQLYNLPPTYSPAAQLSVHWGHIHTSSQPVDMISQIHPGSQSILTQTQAARACPSLTHFSPTVWPAPTQHTDTHSSQPHRRNIPSSIETTTSDSTSADIHPSQSTELMSMQTSLTTFNSQPTVAGKPLFVDIKLPQQTQTVATTTHSTTIQSLMVAASQPIATTTSTTSVLVSTSGLSTVTAAEPVPTATTSAVTVPLSATMFTTSSQPVVVVTTPQPVRPFDGTTAWKSFKDHFERVAKVNQWVTNEVKTQHLMLALEGQAADILKDIDDSSPTAYEQIWCALARRYGDIDETLSAKRKFDQRKQTENESVAEFSQALISLYRLAWPNATSEQRDASLKTRFEEGLNHIEMQQYLRLHAIDDSFSDTVNKARRFAATLDTPRPRKTVRISTPPPRDSIQLVQDQTSFNDKMDKLTYTMEDMIRCMQKSSNPPAAARSTSSSPARSSADTGRGGQSPRHSPAPRSNQGQAARNVRLNENRQNGADSRDTRRQSRPQSPNRQYVRPFTDLTNADRQQLSRQSPRPPTLTGAVARDPRPAAANSNFTPPTGFGGRPRRPPGIQPGACWVCSQFRCHSSRHAQGNQLPPSTSPRPPPFHRCWTCGAPGCRSRYHAQGGRPITPPPSFQQQGNTSGIREPGDRDPRIQTPLAGMQPPRPTSH